MATPIQALTFYLASPIDATQTSIPVRGLKDSRGNAIIAMPAGATKIYFTLEPRSSANQEACSFTGITNNGNGIVTLTGCERNLNPQPPFTALSPTVPHANNAEAVISDSPQFYLSYMQADQAQTVTAIWTFNALPQSAATPALPAEFVTKAYADSLTFAGAATASTTVKGISELATPAELAAGTPTGSSGPLVAPGSAFTDTFVAAAKVPVTKATGKLDPLMIPTVLLQPTVQVFTAGGTYTKPANLVYAVIEVQGAGASGASVASGGGAGIGGSAGSYAKKTLAAASIAATVTITVGTGGAATSGGAGSSAGGDSSFGSTVIAGGATTSAGGTATGGDLNLSGNVGSGGFSQSSPSSWATGKGGDSQYGDGGRIRFGTGSNESAGSAPSATAYGAGGGGAFSNNGAGVGANSAAGINGVVIITSYLG